MPSLWASLLAKDRGQTGTKVRVTQSHTELALDQPVRHPFVVVVEAARHRRELGGFECDEGRRQRAEQRRGGGDDRLGRRRIVVADIIDGSWPRPADRGSEHTCQILDMNAGEDLARLVDPFRGAGAQRLEGAAARAVNGGKAEDV